MMPISQIGPCLHTRSSPLFIQSPVPKGLGRVYHAPASLKKFEHVPNKPEYKPGVPMKIGLQTCPARRAYTVDSRMARRKLPISLATKATDSCKKYLHDVCRGPSPLGSSEMKHVCEVVSASTEPPNLKRAGTVPKLKRASFTSELTKCELRGAVKRARMSDRAHCCTLCGVISFLHAPSLISMRKPVCTVPAACTHASLGLWNSRRPSSKSDTGHLGMNDGALLEFSLQCSRAF